MQKEDTMLLLQHWLQKHNLQINSEEIFGREASLETRNKQLDFCSDLDLHPYPQNCFHCRSARQEAVALTKMVNVTMRNSSTGRSLISHGAAFTFALSFCFVVCHTSASNQHLTPKLIYEIYDIYVSLHDVQNSRKLDFQLENTSQMSKWITMLVHMLKQPLKQRVCVDQWY